MTVTWFCLIAHSLELPQVKPVL